MYFHEAIKTYRDIHYAMLNCWNKYTRKADLKIEQSATVITLWAVAALCNVSDSILDLMQTWEVNLICFNTFDFVQDAGRPDMCGLTFFELQKKQTI